jgi:hypothetical protein
MYPWHYEIVEKKTRTRLELYKGDLKLKCRL